MPKAKKTTKKKKLKYDRDYRFEERAARTETTFVLLKLPNLW